MNSVARWGGVRGGACVTHIHHGRKPGGVESEWQMDMSKELDKMRHQSHERTGRNVVVGPTA